MAEYTYPTNAELTEIASDKVEVVSANRLAFQIMPMVPKDDHFVAWEQKDFWAGMQHIRGLNGQPGLVKPVGARRFMAEPGVYGDYMPLDERELTTRAPWMFGLGQGYIDLSDAILERQDQLLDRRITRIESSIWALLLNGTYQVFRGNVLMATDTFSIRTYTAATPWSTAATATPLADLRAISLAGRGTNSNFGGPARAYANKVTINRLMANTNANDLGGRRVNGLQRVNSLGEINLMLGGENVATIIECEDGYHDEDDKEWHPYIPDGKLLVIGARPTGQRVGEYRMTRNANNANIAPGAYTLVNDNLGREVPRKIEVHDGHNGGPVMYYPGSILVANV